MSGKTVADAVSAILALKDARTRLKQSYDEQDKVYADKIAQIETFIMRRAQEGGVDSFKTPFGTAAVRPTLKASVGDATALKQWVLETGNTEVYQSRLSTQVIREWAENHGGDVPPGVNVYREMTVSVTRPRTTATTKE